MVFVSHFRDVLARDLPALARHVEAEWPAALLGSEGPDGWFFAAGQKRPDTHFLDAGEPATWVDAMTRWLESYGALRPGRELRPVQASFLAGYLSHLGLDTWGEQYQDPRLPSEARSTAPKEWYPSELGDTTRVRAALRRLGEAPFPGERLVDEGAIRAAALRAPAELNPDAIARVAVGILPALPLVDPWQISLVNPLREVPSTPAARAEWDARRGAQAEATDAEYDALLRAASDFTLRVVRKWW